jgi:17beta-estradiol 17-dehydrogenase / very-long-chain 3-oxoacyl-CoA reductase
MGDWAVVTGATDGIGEALAFEFARKGLNVLLLSRTEAKLAATEAAILAKHPKVVVEHLAVDFGDFNKGLQASVAKALEGKAVAVLVNNVGQSYSFCQYFHELDQAEVGVKGEGRAKTSEL